MWLMVWGIFGGTVPCAIVGEYQFIYMVLPVCLLFICYSFQHMQIVDFIRSTAPLVFGWYGLVFSCLTPHSFVN